MYYPDAQYVVIQLYMQKDQIFIGDHRSPCFMGLPVSTPPALPPLPLPPGQRKGHTCWFFGKFVEHLPCAKNILGRREMRDKSGVFN